MSIFRRAKPMFVIDAMKELLFLTVVVLFAVSVAFAINAWNTLPEYVWHLR